MVFMYWKPDYQWHRAVQDAINEKDSKQVGIKIQLAEFAIFRRIDSFSRRDQGEEEEALFEALVTVRILKIRNILPRPRNGY
jgi:hypothetical protein